MRATIFLNTNSQTVQYMSVSLCISVIFFFFLISSLFTSVITVTQHYFSRERYRDTSIYGSKLCPQMLKKANGTIHSSQALVHKYHFCSKRERGKQFVKNQHVFYTYLKNFKHSTFICRRKMENHLKNYHT